MSALLAQLGALAATLAVELTIALAFTLALVPAGRRAALPWTALFANLASHSLASAALWTFHANFFALEAAVIAFELLAFRLAAGLPWSRAAWLSAVSNVASAALALWLRAS
jgi:hypothetical protein